MAATVGAVAVSARTPAFGGGGTTPAALSNTMPGLSGLTIADSTFQGYTGRTITLGFSEGTGQATDRASDVTIVDDTLGDMARDNATSIGREALPQLDRVDGSAFDPTRIGIGLLDRSMPTTTVTGNQLRWTTPPGVGR